MTYTDAATLHGVTVESIRRWVNGGLIKRRGTHTNDGRQHLDMESVMALLRERRARRKRLPGQRRTIGERMAQMVSPDRAKALVHV